jgi:putative MATE family efflux protein
MKMQQIKGELLMSNEAVLQAPVQKKRFFSNKDLFKLIVPLAIEQVLVMLVGMIDTGMISYAGEAAVSGVSLVDMINNLCITILAAVATGGAVIVSQYIGAKEPEKANRAASQLVMAAAIISVIIMAICLLFNAQILNSVYGAVEPEVMSNAQIYFRITALSFPFLGLYNAGAAIYRSMKKTNVTMYVSILSNLINIVGNYFGVFVFNMGVAGVAIPTLAARAVSAIIMIRLSYSKKNEIYLITKDVITPHADTLSRIFKIAIPNGIENGLFMLGKVLVSSIIALFGTTSIAANGISNSIMQLAILMVTANNLAIVTIIGQCVGASDYEQAHYYVKKILTVSYISTIVLTIVIALLLPWVLSMYDVSEETRNLAYQLIMIHNVIACFIHPLAFNMSNVLRAAGDVTYTMCVGVISMFTCRLAGAYVLGVWFNMGVIGVWYAMCIDWVGRALFLCARYKSGKWKGIQTI